MNTSIPHVIKRDEEVWKYYYIHEKKLGEGGFAKVRLATHLESGQYVAIKCLDKAKLGPELPRIYNEIECLKRLRHPNIARLYQVFETQTIIYLVLEYCPGGELFDYIVSKSKLDENEAAQILHDLMRVLDFIHFNGFAHRDLKPENVLFDAHHNIKLIDFGLAANCTNENMAQNSKQQPLDQLSTCCGSVTYAAPEVISGETYSGTQVDVWSAGVMLYAILIGSLPFNDNNVQKLYSKIQAGIKALPSFLSADARDLIRRMLTVDPTKRITVREVLAHPWIRSRANTFARPQPKSLDIEITITPEKRSPIKRSPVKRLPGTTPEKNVAVKRTPDKMQESPYLGPSKRSRFVTVTTNSNTPDKTQGYSSPYRTPVRRGRFVTVTNTPRTPKTLPSYLRQLQELQGSPRIAVPETVTGQLAAATAAAVHNAAAAVTVPQTRPPTLQQSSTNKNGLIITTPTTTTNKLTSKTLASNRSKTTDGKKSKTIKSTDYHQQENIGSRMAAFIYGSSTATPTPKKSIVKRLFESATPKKLRRQVCKKPCVCK